MKEAAVKRHGMEEKKKKKAMNPRNSSYAEKKFKKKKSVYARQDYSVLS